MADGRTAIVGLRLLVRGIRVGPHSDSSLSETMGSKSKKALSEAAGRGDVERVRVILADGIKANSIIDGRHGWTAIMYAAFHGHVEPTKVLIENDADVNHIDHEKNSPLTLAASKNYWDVAAALADAGADVTHENLKGKSALTYARHAKQKAFLKKWQPAEADSD